MALLMNIKPGGGGRMSETNSSDKILYILSYISMGLVGVILLLIKKDDRTARFHGFNSLFFGLAVFIVNFILGFIPIIGWMLMPLVSLVAFVYSIYLAYQVHKDENIVIPVITDFAQKYVGE